MLELLTTAEFARWFDRLGDTEAEDVATALEVLAASDRAAGPNPRHGSTMLLWYEDPTIRPHWWHAELHDYLKRAEYARALVRKLESAGASERFAQLPIGDSRRALFLVNTIRRQASAEVLRLRLRGARNADLDGELRRACAALSALLGGGEAPSHIDGALRELQVASGETRLRILFGLDFSRQQGLLVLGERLDRGFYGDSVRRALRQWERFRAGDRAALAAAPAAGR